MPVLTQNINGDTNNPHYGRGVESVGFSAVGYKDTNKLYPIPEVITSDYLQSHPFAIPAFRRVARLALLDTAPPDITDKIHAKNIVNILRLAAISEIGSVNRERTDGDRTTNYVIPLSTNKGPLEIVVNGAWGVSWRLGKGHSLVIKYPSLAVCQPEDMSLSLGEKKTGIRSYYIDPKILEAITSESINPEHLAQRIQAYLQKLLKTKEAKYEKSSARQGYGLAGEENVQTFSLKTDTWSRSVPHLGISFELGDNEGIKSLDIYGNTYQERSHNLDTFAKEGAEIGALIRSFYYPQK